MKVSVIQGNIPQEQKWDPRYRSAILEKYDNLTRLASYERPDLIVWPETAVPGYLEKEPDIDQFLSKLAKELKIYLLVGSPRRSGLVEDYFNSAVLFDPEGQMITFYDKQQLVPFAEFMPSGEFMSKFRRAFRIDENFELADFRAGEEPIIFTLPKGKFGVLICFEDFFTVAEFIQNGAEFMINITNDGWFKKSSAPYQHAQASVFRAVEYRVPLVRCSNTGVSEFIDIYGRVYLSLSDETGQNLMISGYKAGWVAFPPSHQRIHTFYTNHEYWFAKLCLTLLGLIILALIFIRTPPSRNLKQNT